MKKTPKSRRKISVMDRVVSKDLEDLEDVLELRNKDVWNEHPKYPRKDWKYEVANNYTNLGYWDWVVSAIEGVVG